MSKNSAPGSLENKIKVRPSELKEVIALHVMANVPIFLWGGPGIGKSAIARQVAIALGFTSYQDVRLSQMDQTDIRGIPVPIEDAQGRPTVKWSFPSFYSPDTGFDASGKRLLEPLLSDPSKTGPACRFYLFDEMNTAPQSVQAAAYQLVLDRKAGDHEFGPDDYVMAAGNRETDRGATFKMATPLANRFVHIELQVNAEDWQEYAILSGFNPSVVGYIEWKKNDLNKFEATTASMGFPTPRSWEAVSKIMNAYEAIKNGKSLRREASFTVSANSLRASIEGAVGTEAATNFLEFYKRTSDLPKPSDILRGIVTKFPKTEDVGLIFTLTMSLGYEIREMNDNLKRIRADVESKLATQAEYEAAKEEYDTSMNNMIGFLLDNTTDEMIVVGVCTVIKKLTLAINYKLENWIRFRTQYGKYISVAES